MTTEGLYAALVAVQAEMPIVHKGETATVPTKNGGSYRYSYADLASISAAMTPLLTKHNLAYVCQPRRCDDGAYELMGSVVHTSGESVSGSLPIYGHTAQEIGSSITYGRRYLLGCLIGVITDEDDDAASAGDYRTGTRRPQQPEQPPAPPPPTDDGTPMTDRTRGALFATLTEAGITDEQEQRDRMSRFLGRTVESRSSLTEQEARRITAAIKAARHE